MNKKFIGITAAAAAVFVASACSLQPTYERPALPSAGALPISAKSRPNTIAAANIGWRDFVGDPCLQAIIALALENNRDLQMAILHVEAAQAQYQVARLAFLPNGDLFASKTTSRTPRDLLHHDRAMPVASTYTVGPQVSWEIDLFGRALSLKHEALADYFAIAENRKAAQISLIAAVANQYVLIQAADAQIAVTRDTLAMDEEDLRLTKLRFDIGSVSELDEQQAETSVALAQANLQEQMRERETSINALILLVGAALPNDLPPARPLDNQEFLSDIAPGLPSDLLERRPDVAAAEQQLIAANADIGAARVAFFPSVTLTASLGTESPQLSGLFKPGSLSWGYSPQITLPIFQGGQLHANLELSEVRKQIQVATYEKTIQTAFREVADGLVARATYDRQLQHLTRDVSAQNRRLEIARLRYRQGVDSEFAVLEAEQALYATQQQLVEARQERLTNLVDLYQYLGGGWIEHTGDRPRDGDAA